MHFARVDDQVVPMGGRERRLCGAALLFLSDLQAPSSAPGVGFPALLSRRSRNQTRQLALLRTQAYIWQRERGLGRLLAALAVLAAPPMRPVPLQRGESAAGHQ